ncbi:MAG TPA: hypothetical protein DIS59_04965 [Candidatus Magasanikbacteria bacterium]|nr:MAG: hypothetical protein UW10_C0007G0049 [Candidatus Magasanikbacteria bacterium GW2011_GWA2_43_9]HBB38419.1 hypothetical protein [Candidatus Magasanikbacteria bacterium]HCM54255.1 hypothetical protein [Candidatus Magasanikbacteria bacterium]
MHLKRIMLIIGFILVVIGLGYAIYVVFFTQQGFNNPQSTTTTETPTGSQFPTAGQGTGTSTVGTPSDRLPSSNEVPDTSGAQGTTDSTGSSPLVNQLVEQPISNASSASNGGVKFYNQADGKFYHVTATGAVDALADTTFFNVSSVDWSPKRNEAIIEYPDGANIYYNFDTKEQVTLPQHWESFSFEQTGDKIAAKSIGFSEENQWLVVSDPKGTNVTPIEPLGQNAAKVIVDWSPNNSVIALSRTGESLGSDRQEVLLLGQYGENFKSVIVEGRDLRSTWSPNGEKLLHSVYSAQSEYQPQLWVVNASGDTIGSGRKLLNVNTWADKCAFADDRYVYCGVPRILEKGSGFVPALADAAPDDIIRIDTQTGLKQQIQTDGVHTVDSMFLGDSGRTLYFTDKNQTGLFQIPL